MGDVLPTFWLIAGPNGVGKTTFAFKRLKAVSGSIRFVNIDGFSHGLSPLDPKAAEGSGRQSAFRDEDVLADGHPAPVRMVPA